MSAHATIESIIGWLDNGTGDPGLEFGYDDEAKMIPVREEEDGDLWIIWPVTVQIVHNEREDLTDAERGPHERCTVLVTIKTKGDRTTFNFLACDADGEVVAAHEV